MGSWSLETFADSDDLPDIDAIARRIVDLSNTAGAVVSDDLCPFDGERLGIRVNWPSWWIIAMARHGPDVTSDAAAIAKSRATPAEVRRRLDGCDQSVRVIFGPDDERLFTDTILEVAEYLNELSDSRTYDPQQKRFWPSSKAG